MRKVLLDTINPGMILGKSITAADGTVLLGAGIKLTDRYICRLKELGISSVFIWDERTADVELTGPIQDSTRLKAAGTVREVVDQLQTSLHRSVVVKDNLPQLRAVVDDILNDLLCSGKLLLDFIEIKALDDYTFFHSVNVCVLALLVGIRQGLTENRLQELGLGALLHDLGKSMVPKEILLKPGRLNPEEWEVMKTHPAQGFEMLRETQEVPLLAAHVTYQHHERHNGTGYPRQLAGDQIHPYARLAAICDVFDALTSDRVYRHRHPPHEVIELILGSGGTLFDFDLVKEFTQCVAMYPLGSQVELSNGLKGIVVQVPNQLPQRPVVRVLQDEKGRKLGQPYDLSLVEHPNLAVVNISETT